MLTCLIGDNKINLVENKYEKEELKKWSSKRILKCPICGKDYEYCHGKVKMPYFRHKDKEECNYLYSESETQEHLQGKTDLYNWLLKQSNVTKVELEAYIPETKQRPDIMFEWNGQKCVIEYQCTPIASEYYERHELYEACGIKDIWICGTEKYLENSTSKKFRKKEIEKNTMYYYDSEYKLFITNMKLHEEKIKLLNGCNYFFKFYRALQFPIEYWLKYPNNLICDLSNVIIDNNLSISFNSIIEDYFNSIFGDDIDERIAKIEEEKNIERQRKIEMNIKINKILENTKDFLLKNFDITLYNNRYEIDCIEIGNICFKINEEDNSYLYFLKKFYKYRDYYGWRWGCDKEYISKKHVNEISFNSFLAYVIGWLKQQRIYDDYEKLQYSIGYFSEKLKEYKKEKNNGFR